MSLHYSALHAIKLYRARSVCLSRLESSASSAHNTIFGTCPVQRRAIGGPISNTLTRYRTDDDDYPVQAHTKPATYGTLFPRLLSRQLIICTHPSDTDVAA